MYKVIDKKVRLYIITSKGETSKKRDYKENKELKLT